MPSRLFLIPREVLEHTATFLDPPALASFSQTCRTVHTLTAPENTHLWRVLYLSRSFDDPRLYLPDGPAAEVDWSCMFKLRIAAERKLDRRSMLNAVADCIRTVSLFGPKTSADLSWAIGVIRARTEVFEDIAPKPDGENGSSHCAHGAEPLPPLDPEDEETRMFIRASLPLELGSILHNSFYTRRRAARTFVYDMRNYMPDCAWGPFMTGANAVSWKHIDAIVTVISANLRDFGNVWPTLLQPSALVVGAKALGAHSSRIPGAPISSIDWAGIEGEWMRIVCFCDYRDLIRFNRGRCNPEFFHDDFEEATRLLRMHLKVDGYAEDVKSADSKRPALRFSGKMRGFSSLENLDRTVKGVVCVMPSGDIRWSFVSMFQGEEQWGSEGIQLGGVASGAGVVGTWSGAQHSPGDPAGPYWSFKVDDRSVQNIDAWPPQ